MSNAPLIKDPAIRKAVRAWADANQPKFMTSNGNYTACDNRGLMIEFNNRWTTYMENGKRYTIDELCGEEEDYTEPEPEKTELIEEIEEAAKRADARAGRALEKIVELTATLKASISRINEIERRLKTTEEITERPPREDDEQNPGEVKQYRLELPPSVAFERMKQDLRDWIEKNKIDKIKTWFYTDRGGRRGVMFGDKTNAGANTLIIIGWPTIGLVDGAIYTPDELLITGEAGKE